MTQISDGNEYLRYRFDIEALHDEIVGTVNLVYCPSWPNLVNASSVYEIVAKVHEKDTSAEHRRNGPIVVVDRYGGAPASIFCIVSSLAMEMEYDKTCNIYTYSKLYHNKRPGIWSSVEEIQQIYRILTYLPSEPKLLQLTEIRTEMDDQPTATPDLYSKICSNGNISSQLLPASNSFTMNGNGIGNGGCGGGAGGGMATIIATTIEEPNGKVVADIMCSATVDDEHTISTSNVNDNTANSGEE